MICKNCKSKLSFSLVDMGFSPYSNSYLTNKNLNESEDYYPLRVFVCKKCFLVQTQDFASQSKIFSRDYAYYSSTSQLFLDHAKKYSRKIIKSLNLDKKKLVIEVASNDGYLLQNFINKKIPCLGIEPASGVAKRSEKKGIKVIKKFFSSKLARSLSTKKADLICANNVYAHVPNINDFTKGLQILLKHEGTITLEFPHLLKLIKDYKFDTIYHEHYSYLSLFVVKNIFKKNNLRVYHVEEIATHGGSLRVYGCHLKANIEEQDTVKKLLKKEIKYQLDKIKTYENYNKKINEIKYNFLSFLIKQKKLKKKICGYGAAAKASTLINYCGIKNDLIEFIYDAADSKQNKFLPGSHIPILHPKNIKKDKPDLIIIFPWNLSKEIIQNLNYVRRWNCKFIVAVPKIKYL
jgi:hypothetical protein